MIIRSLLRLKSFTVAIMLLTILVGYSAGSVVLGSKAYPVRIVREIVLTENPNIEVYASTPILPGGLAPGARVYSGGPARVEAVQDIVELAGRFGDAVLGEYARWAKTQVGRLYECTAQYTILGGSYTGSPILLFAPAGPPVPLGGAGSINTTPEAIAESAIRYVGADRRALEYARIYASTPSFSPAYSYAYEVPSPEEQAGKGEGGVFLVKEVGFEMWDVAPYVADWEPLGAQAVVLNVSGQQVLVAYMYKSVHVIVAGGEALKCLGLSPPGGWQAEPGDGVVTGIVSPLVGWLLGIPDRSWGEARLGSTVLRLWNPGIDSGFYSFLQTPSEAWKWPRHLLYAIIIPPGEAADLDGAIRPPGPDSPGLLPSVLTYLLYGRGYESNTYTSVSPLSPAALDRFASTRSAVLAPSLAFLEALGRANATEIVENTVKYRAVPAEVPRPFASPVAALAVGSRYNAELFASGSWGEVAPLINEQTSLIEEAASKLTGYGVSPDSPECRLLPPPQGYRVTSGYVINGYEARFFIPPWVAAAPCIGAVVVDRDVTLDLAQSLSGGSLFSNSIIALGVVSLLPSAFAAGWVVGGDTIELLIASSRRWLSTAIARGVDIRRARRRLVLVISLASIGLGLAGAILAGAWTLVGMLGRSPGGIGAFLRGNAVSIAVSALVAAASVAIVALRRTRSMLSISPSEAVRPVLSIVRAPRPAPGRLNRIALLIYLLVVAVGFSRLNFENLDLDWLGPLGYVVMIILVFAVALSPLGPLLGLLEASRASTLALANRRVGRAINRLFLARSGELARLAESSGETIRDLVLSATRAGGLAIGLAIGSALSGPALREFPRIIAGSGGLSRDTLIGTRIVSGVFGWLGPVAAILAIMMTSIVVLSVYRLIRMNIVVLRARGASTRQAIVFVYASLTPFIVTALVSGLVTGAAFFLGVDAIIGVVMPTLGNARKTPHLPLALGPWEAALIAALVAALWLIPLVVSYEAARARDLARLLREG